MMNLRVFYGYARLTKKIMRKRQLVIFFENEYALNNIAWIDRRMFVVHIRYQTEDEMKDAENITRRFTRYGYFIDEKPFRGNIEKVLEMNMLADSKNVSKQELEEIKLKLRNAFYSLYPRKSESDK